MSEIRTKLYGWVTKLFEAPVYIGFYMYISHSDGANREHPKQGINIVILENNRVGWIRNITPSRLSLVLRNVAKSWKSNCNRLVSVKKEVGGREGAMHHFSRHASCLPHAAVLFPPSAPTPAQPLSAGNNKLLRSSRVEHFNYY